MFKIKVTYNENALRDKLRKAAQDGFVKEVKNTLAPFEEEITKEAGEVNIQITDKLTVSVNVTGISPGLKERVENGLNGN